MINLKNGLQRSIRPLSVDVLYAIAIGLESCTSNTPATDSASRQLQVVTTFIPITDFTKAVAGDRCDVSTLSKCGDFGLYKFDIPTLKIRLRIAKK